MHQSGEFDSRTFRIARSAVGAGYEVTVYGRWEPGLPRDTTQHGYRVVRVPIRPRVVLPLLGSRGVAVAAAPAELDRAGATGSATTGGVKEATREGMTASRRRTSARGGIVRRARELLRARRSMLLAPLRWGSRTRNRWLLINRRMVSWAMDLDAVTEPADIWHGRLIGGLPAAVRQARRHGGVAIYDSGDVYVQSRNLAAGGGYAALVAFVERRWARRCAAIVTVNEPYADLLEAQLGLGRPTVVMNCSDPVPEGPSPDLLRQRLGIAQSTRVVLYQGALLTERGIEQGMEAILDVRDAVLVLMGVGLHEELYRRLVQDERYRGRVLMTPAVAPAELLRWTSSADAVLVAIQPTSPNHLHSTPNKLFEAIAAGVPVVASDLPGMAPIVRETGCGVLVDPTSPAAIADGIRGLLDVSESERAAVRERCRRAARETYNWRSQERRLLDLYESVLRRPATVSGG